MISPEEESRLIAEIASRHLYASDEPLWRMRQWKPDSGMDESFQCAFTRQKWVDLIRQQEQSGVAVKDSARIAA